MKKTVWIICSSLLSVLAIAGICAGFYYASDRVSVVTGCLVGFAVYGGFKRLMNPVYLLLRRLAPPEHRAKMEKREREEFINNNDERSTQINAFSSALSGKMLHWGVLGLTVLMYLFAQPLWLAHIALGLVYAHVIAELIILIRYNKKM